MINNIKCERAFIVLIISAVACVSRRSVSFSKCSLGSIHLNISFVGVNRLTCARRVSTTTA